MTPWLLVMVYITTAPQPIFLVLPAKTEHGCEMRKMEFLQHLPTPPIAFMYKCIFLPPYFGSV